MLTNKNKEIVAVESMCPSSNAAADEPRALCIIRDHTSGQVANRRMVINLPASTTASQLMQEVGKNFHYDPETFELILLGKSQVLSIEVFSPDRKDLTLEEMNFHCGDDMRNSLGIYDKNSKQPKRSYVENESFSFDLMGNVHRSSIPAPPPLPQSSEFVLRDLASECTSSSQNSFGESYVGLVNQAMTCYLNSLLQTLFMTPEFRNALYRWEFDGTEEEGTKSIPFQLQKLFLQLQTSNRPAVGTTELTTSFGWDSSEAWQQHDVQELCRVMFDALEHKFRNTEQALLISNLYAGKLKDYVKCLECGYVSAREDTFLDVPLVVRPFGSDQAYGSVEEALEAFVTPETLQGSNQYFCEHCNKKCDAHKGLKFTSFPYLLTLQLKRFDFDPLTMRRLKLNDRVSFPELLSLNEFIKDSSITDNENNSCESAPLSPDISASSNATDDDEGICIGSYGSDKSHELHCVNERNIQKSMEKGPYVYELFSIMIHSGSANGGHYYAYIKSFQHGDWYCFNDSQVSKITYDDIQKTYGGGPARGFFSGAYSSSTNAYMLMYRQINKEKNKEFMSIEELPKHTSALLQSMQEQEERERQQRELDRSMCKITLFCRHPVHFRTVEMTLKVRTDCNLAEATQTAFTIMGLEGVVPLECCRLVKYDSFSDYLECSFDDPETTPISSLLVGSKSNHFKGEAFLEIRKPTDEFQEYRPGGLDFKVYIVDLEEEIVSVPFSIRIQPSDCVAQLKSRIAQVLDISADQVEQIRIVHEGYDNQYIYLDLPNQAVRLSEGFQKSNKAYIEYKDAEDAQKPYQESKFCQIIESYSHHISIDVFLPKYDSDNVSPVKTFAVESKRRCKLSKENIEESYVAREVTKIHFTKMFWTQECDEGLGDSEMGDSVASNCIVGHSDQSEDSSQTDSERTLIGDSPRNNSPDVSGNEIDSEMDSYQHPEVSKPECDSGMESSECHNMSSPEENIEDSHALYKNITESVSLKCYFKAFLRTDYETKDKYLKVYVNKFITLDVFKKKLEPHVGLSSERFKLFIPSSSEIDFEYEYKSFCNNLVSLGDDKKLIIKPVLCNGEYHVKIYRLCLPSSEPFQFITDMVIKEGTTVLQIKKELIPCIQEKFDLCIPVDKYRLRKKLPKSPGYIYFDHQQLPLPDDVPINDKATWELYLELLDDAQSVTSPQHHVIFCRRWHPGALTLGPLKEVIFEQVQKLTLDVLIQRFSEISGLPQDCIEIAMFYSSVFTNDDPKFNEYSHLLWISLSHPFGNEKFFNWQRKEGDVVLFREKLEASSEEEKEDIYSKENTKSYANVKNYFSPKKEKALKIYTIESNSTTNGQTGLSQNSTSNPS